MLSYLALAASFAAAYLIGSFPTSYLIAKYRKGFDIRQVGSQNAGATNVFRSVGKVAGLVTLVVDILKGLFVVTVIAPLFYSFDVPLVWEFYKPFLGLLAVCGHVWPVFLKFHGGKGVATTIGVGIGLAPLPLGISVLIWTAVFLLSGYVSLASIISLTVFPILTIALGGSLYLTIISAIICSISIYKHRSNIARLVKGVENKTVVFK